MTSPWRIAGHLILVIGLAVCSALFTAAATAQTTAPGARSGSTAKPVQLPSNLTEKQVDGILSRMTDAQLRELMRDFLVERARRNEGSQVSSVVANFRRNVARIGTRLPLMFEEFPALMGGLASGIGAMSDGQHAIPFWRWLTWLLVVLAMGGAIWWISRRGASRLSARGVLPGGERHAVWLGEAIGLILFLVAAATAFVLVAGGNERALTLYWAVLGGIGVAATGAAVSRALLLGRADDHPETPLRLEAHRRYVIFATIAGVGFGLNFLLRNLQVPEPPVALVAMVVGWIAASLLVSAILRSMRLSALRPESAAGPRRSLIHRSWGAIVIAYVMVVFTIWTFRLLSGSPFVFAGPLLSMALLVGGLLVDAGFRRLLGRSSSKDAAARRNSWKEALVIGLRILLVVGGTFLFLHIWGVDLLSGVTGTLGPVLTRAIIDIALVAFVAIVLVRAIRNAIDQKLEEQGMAPAAEQEHDEGGGQPKSRLATLLPLARGLVSGTVAVIAVLIILSRLGVDIGPVLAGAGVVGLAIGFGSQTLVRDVVSGAFFLIDDAFRVGEYVESGSLRGTVERIGLRSLRLRHHRGMIHTVPYGELKSVTNYSRDWAIMKLQFKLPFGTDMEKVRKLIKRTGQQMAESPEFADKMLAPLKSQGVVRAEGAGLVFSVKFTAKPGEQFVIRREAFRRIQEALQAEGIEFAPDSVAVRVVGDQQAAAKLPPEALAGAAATAKSRPVDVT